MCLIVSLYSTLLNSMHLAFLFRRQPHDSFQSLVNAFDKMNPTAKGSVFDVECRDSSTGDGAFLQVSTNVDKPIADIKDSFFLDNLLAATGRFSFYGPPTDVKILKSTTDGNYRVIDLSFSTISQATQSEIPRKARLVATIPEGSLQAVMLIASASAIRWKKGSDKSVASTIDSFRAIPAPQGSLRVRGTERPRS